MFETGIWLFKLNIVVQYQVFVCYIPLEANAQSFQKLLEAGFDFLM